MQLTQTKARTLWLWAFLLVALVVRIWMGWGPAPGEVAIFRLPVWKELPPAKLTIINGSEPETLDPALITSLADSRIVRCLFEGLTRLNGKTARAEPALAESWEISEDGTLYTFFLRKDARWSDGRAITSADVVYSWLRVLDPKTAADYAGQLYFIENAENYNTGKRDPETRQVIDARDVGVWTVDEHTVQVRLVGPTAFFLDLCAFPTLAIVPQHWIEEHGDKWVTTPGLPVNGTYQLEFWKLNDRVRVRANPAHWTAHKNEVQSKVVDFIPMSSPSTALNLYESGEADIIWDKSLIPSSLMDVLRKRNDCHTFGYLGSYFFRFNLTRKPFDDVRVRKALALAIDKNRIVENITKAGEQVANHFVPLGTADYESPAGLGHDPDLARKLLAEAGYPGGKGFPVFTYLMNNAPIDAQISVELQAMWEKELGVKMEIRQTEWKVYLNEQSKLNFDLSRSSWIGDYNDANTFLDLFMSNNGNNRTGWKNAEYDRIIRTANLQTDKDTRKKMLQSAESLLIRDDLVIVPIYFYAGVNFFDPEKISGIYFNLLDEHPIHLIRKKG
jgi:oligopeptide transport system substrate-binding protein